MEEVLGGAGPIGVGLEEVGQVLEQGVGGEGGGDLVGGEGKGGGGGGGPGEEVALGLLSCEAGEGGGGGVEECAEGEGVDPFELVKDLRFPAVIRGAELDDEGGGM